MFPNEANKLSQASRPLQRVNFRTKQWVVHFSYECGIEVFANSVNDWIYAIMQSDTIFVTERSKSTIPSNYQPADIFTEALGHLKHYRFCQMTDSRNSFEVFDDADLMRDWKKIMTTSNTWIHK